MCRERCGHGIGLEGMGQFHGHHESLDFFLWGYVKEIVYRTKVREMTDLRQRISNALQPLMRQC